MFVVKIIIVESEALPISRLHYRSMADVYWRNCLWWGNGNAHLRMPYAESCIVHRIFDAVWERHCTMVGYHMRR